MTRRDEILARIHTWDPADTDLPDDVAAAIDADPAVRAAFDARFGPPQLSLVDSPPAPPLARPAAARRPWGAIALAATALFAVGLWPVFLGAELEPTGDNKLSVDAGSFEELHKELDDVGHAGLEDLEDRVGDIDANLLGRLQALGYVDGPSSGSTRDLNRGERYQHEGTAPRIHTIVDPVATFGLDVDTASWVLTRSKLEAGYLPPPASVRVEGFVNRLPFDYPQPEPGVPFALNAETVPSPFSPDHHIVRIGVQARDVAAGARKPAHLTFLVDTSGSMSAANKLPLVMHALTRLVEQLGDGDTVALVVYAGGAGVVLEPTDAANKQEILAALGAMSAGGSTAMGAGIQVAYDLAEQAFAPGAVNRVVVASDGDANVGHTSHGPLAEAIRHYADKGITLTTVGVGTGNYHDTMMEGLAQQGDGMYAYLDGPAEAERVFVEELVSTMEVVARDAKAQVSWHPAAVRSWRQLGYENRRIDDEAFRDDTVDAGEIGAGHQVTVLYEVELEPGGVGPLGTVSLRAKPPGADAPASEFRWPLGRDTVLDRFEDAQRGTQVAIAAASFAEVLRGSPYALDRPLEAVMAKIDETRRAGVPEDMELQRMARRAVELTLGHRRAVSSSVISAPGDGE